MSDLKSKIDKLDLTKVKAKFLSRKGWWWKLKNDVNIIEKDYRKFLYLLGTEATMMVPWTQNLDDFWHEHILDTAQYAKDCEHLFGKMIHHNPHLPVGTAAHKVASKATSKAYSSAFKEPKKKDDSASSCSSCSSMPSVFIASSCASSSPSCSSGSSASCSSGSSCGGGGSSCGGGGGGCGGGGCGGGGD